MGKNINILLNGATSGTNFGDFLFAEMFHKHVAEQIGKDHVFWYKSRFALSDFYAKYLNYKNNYKFSEIDGLIYISGGYFCGNDKNYKDHIKRYLRYFSIGIRCLLAKKPYAIIGMEVGDSKSFFIRMVQQLLLKKARFLVVRNEESLTWAKKYGVKDVICTADSVFALESAMFEDRIIPEEIDMPKSKLLLLHIYPYFNRNEQIKQKVIPVINKFLEAHREYSVVLAADQYSDEQDEVMDELVKLINAKTIKYKYEDPVALCKVISKSDMVITTKLHVGIVGALLKRSVISFSIHTDKIKRLYNQLNEQGRTAPLDELTVEKGVEMLEKYNLKPITVPDELIEKAKQNFKTVDDFIKEL